jgi:DNA-binding NarL/FixJ family response regulator
MDTHAMAPMNGSSEGTEKKKRTVRLLIADGDHPIVRDGLKKLPCSKTISRWSAKRRTAARVLEKGAELDPRCPAFRPRMPNLTVCYAAGATTSQQAHRVIILTASEDKNESVQAMKMGCSGIVLKQTAPDLIVKSIRKVNSGEIWLDSHTTAAVMRQFSTGLEGSGSAQGGKGRERSPLSTREREIVAFVAQGYKNKEMAEKMFISEQTVKNHLHNIFDKLGVSDRLELALYAIHKGLHLVGESPAR